VTRGKLAKQAGPEPKKKRGRPSRPVGGYGEVTAREIGLLLGQLSKLIGANPTNNLRLARGLADAGRLLVSAGDTPIVQAIRSRELPNNSGRPVQDLSTAGIEEAKSLVDDPGATRAKLIDLGSTRFGMSRSSLDRMSIERIRDEISTAIQHERSISIISDVAHRGG